VKPATTTSLLKNFRFEKRSSGVAQNSGEGTSASGSADLPHNKENHRVTNIFLEVFQIF
jgi:hypothetical protein